MPTAVPTNVVAAGSSATEIDVTWTDDGPNVAGYIVQSSEDGTENSWTTLTTTPLAASVHEYADSDTGWTEGTVRYYRVMAVGIDENSAYSDPVSGASLLNTPGDAEAQSYSGHEIHVSWTDNSVAEAGYSVEQDSW